MQAAERRALYTARAAFLEVLRQIAEQAGPGGPQTASAALAEALTTLDEADDFVGAAGAPAGDSSRIAAGHRSAAGTSLPSGAAVSQAARHYQAHAAERLAAAELGDGLRRHEFVSKKQPIRLDRQRVE